MKLFLHLKISKEPSGFNSQRGIMEKLDEFIYYDLDNHSEKLVIDTALEAIEKSSCIFLLIESDNSQPGAVLRVIKRLVKFEKQRKLMITHNGFNNLIQKLEKGFGSAWNKNITTDIMIERARLFASSEC